MEEGVPTPEGAQNNPIETNSNFESLNDWRTLKEQAPQRVRDLIKGIERFEEMELEEQMRALERLLKSLEHDNSNRFTCEEIAREIELIKAEMLFLQKANALGIPYRKSIFDRDIA